MTRVETSAASDVSTRDEQNAGFIGAERFVEFGVSSSRREPGAQHAPYQEHETIFGGENCAAVGIADRDDPGCWTFSARSRRTVCTQRGGERAGIIISYSEGWQRVT